MGAMCSGIDGDGKARHENEYVEGDGEDLYQDIDDVTDGYEDPSKIENAANDRCEALEGTTAGPSKYMNIKNLK